VSVVFPKTVRKKNEHGAAVCVGRRGTTPLNFLDPWVGLGNLKQQRRVGGEVVTSHFHERFP
jgi:hypothetical protein